MHFPAEVERPPWGFFMIVGGEGVLGVLVQHHCNTPVLIMLANPELIRQSGTQARR